MPNSLDNTHHQPVVLTISGHDPTGGAGVQADIETFISHGCHPCSILTCLTVQDSTTVHQLIPLDAKQLSEQARILFNDMNITAIKIGLTGSPACVTAIATVLKQHPHIPVIFDPVLASGDGTALTDDALLDAIKDELIPLTTVLTPNTLEASQLAALPETATTESLGLALLNLGTNYVLITGGHNSGAVISNQLFYNNQLAEAFEWPRRTGEFHGTGCTLASAIAARMAQSDSVPKAIQHAQAYTDNAIQHAQAIGQGQLFPNRRCL